jgi:penicillin-binding protein 1C
VDADVSKLYWFVGESFLGTVPPEQALAWTPKQAGRFRVSVVDDHGREDARDIEIAVVQ